MNEKNQTPDFDFDHWVKIAQQEPDKFEIMRKQLIDAQIARTPEHLKQRIIGLQWQIDQIRNQASNPMTACLQISQKMWKYVLGENGLLKTLQEPQKILNTQENTPVAKVLSFQKPKPGNKL